MIRTSGKGEAIVTGCKHVKGDIVSFIDADLEIHPRQLVKFMKKMEETGADIVIEVEKASRFQGRELSHQKDAPQLGLQSDV